MSKLEELLRRWMSDEALDNPHAIYIASEAALSQQTEPALAQDDRRCCCPKIGEPWNPAKHARDCPVHQTNRPAQTEQPVGLARFRDLAEFALRQAGFHNQWQELEVLAKDFLALIDAALSQQAEPVPAQDEQEAFEEWTSRECVCDLRRNQLGNYRSADVEGWWIGWQARATRPAQTATQCNHRFMYFGDQKKRRCADCCVVEGSEQTALSSSPNPAKRGDA